MKTIIFMVLIGFVFSQDFEMDMGNDLSSLILPEISLPSTDEVGEPGLPGLSGFDQDVFTEQPIILPTQRSLIVRNQPIVRIQTQQRAGVAPSYGGYGARSAPIVTPIVRAGPVSQYNAKPTARPTAAPRTSPIYKETPAVRPTARPTAAPRTSPSYNPSAKPTARPTAAPRTSPVYKKTPAVIPTAAPRISSVYNNPRPIVRIAPVVRAAQMDSYYWFIIHVL